MTYMPQSVSAIANIASLRLVTNTSLTELSIFVNGYYTISDGGEGIFVCNLNDTSSSDNNGTIIVDQSGRRWYRKTEGQPYSFRWFGAYGNGTTDDTTSLSQCFSAAISSGQAVYCPVGVFLYSSLNLSGNVLLYGNGEVSSIMTTSSTTGTAITITEAPGGWSEIRGIQFSSKNQQTTGSIIAFNCDGFISDCLFYQYNNALVMTGNVGLIDNVRFQSPTPVTGNGITINGYSGGIMMDRLLFYATGASSQPASGIKVVNAGAVQIMNSEVIQQGIDLYISPGSGQTVSSLWAFNTFFDTATTGIAISPSGSGNIIRLKFVGCWSCSHTANGVTIENAGTGSVGSIIFIGHESMFCTGSGFDLGSEGGTISDLIIQGSRISDNNYGIFIGANVTDFTISNNNIGSAAGGIGGNTNWGIILGTGSQDRFTITNNRILNNGSGSIDDGSTGTSKIITGNIGFNPVGAAIVSLTGSPYSWTNTLGYSVVMIVSGGSVSSVSVNAAQVSTGPCSVVVPPGVIFSLTYSAAPTVERIGIV